MHVLNVLKYLLLISKRMEFFNRLNVIRRVLEIFAILGACSIIVLCQEYAK